MKKKILAIVAVVAIIATMSICLAACDKGGKGEYTALRSQADIFTELNAKTADVGIMDFTMANYLLSTGSEMANKLQIVEDVQFEDEFYGIAFRKGSGKMVDAVNQALAALKNNGKFAEIAANYGLTDNVIDINYTPKTEFTAEEQADWNYLIGKTNSEIVIGYTLNAPMAIKDENTGNLSGFDTDLAKAVFEYINTEMGTSFTLKFQLISWTAKETELTARNIDCIWNGLTVTPERQETMSITINYLKNKQVAMIRKADASKYNSLEALKKARIVAESGSAGEEAAANLLGITL